jgi:RNA polymerase sigma-70 factor, ECF subfamily
MHDFDAIYRDHIRTVWRALARLGVASESLEDAAQDVFLVVHRRHVDFEGRSSLRTWIYGIALRVARDYRRREHKKQRLVEISDDLPTPLADPLEVSSARQARQTLYALLDELDEEKREVLVMAQLEQMSVPEVALALQMNVNGVYARLRAARMQFDKALSRHRVREGAYRE